MGLEVLAFANFNFEIQRMTTKVIYGRGVREEFRYTLNWSDYIDFLQREEIVIRPQSRDFFPQFQTIRQNERFFYEFKDLQAEIRNVLNVIIETKSIPLDIWHTVFKEAESLNEAIRPDPPILDDILEDDLADIEFVRYTTAESYQAFLYGQLRGLIIDKTIFRLRKCPECQRYFIDRTRRGNKIFCSPACGNRDKQRAFVQRRTAGKAAAEKMQDSSDVSDRNKGGDKGD